MMSKDICLSPQKKYHLSDDLVRVEVSGRFGLFTVPAFRSERFSYPVITPTAAVGLMKAVYWHPGMEYECIKIRVINPIQATLSFSSNELSSVPSMKQVIDSISGTTSTPPGIDSNETRQQKSFYLLKNLRYELTIRIVPRENRNGEPFDLNKYREILLRRLKKGQFYRTPYLGISECAACVRLLEPGKKNASFYDGKALDLGTMLYEVVYNHDENNDVINATPYFFHAVMVDGDIILPTREDVIK